MDTPPLLAAADAAILGRDADGVLLVVRAGHVDRAAVHQAMQQLATVGAHLIGAALNDPDGTAAKSGGYYHYEYYGAAT
jgi:Mrp family chromosome partitioning ATPase